MKPKKSPHHDRQHDLFRVELCRIINPSHGLIKLANVVDWDRLDELFGSTYCPDTGRSAVSTRLMVALHYLKYTFNLSCRRRGSSKLLKSVNIGTVVPSHND